MIVRLVVLVVVGGPCAVAYITALGFAVAPDTTQHVLDGLFGRSR